MKPLYYVDIHVAIVPLEDENAVAAVLDISNKCRAESVKNLGRYLQDVLEAAMRTEAEIEGVTPTSEPLPGTEVPRP